MSEKTRRSTSIKLDSRAYSPSTNQGDWAAYPHITMIVINGFIIEALDSDNELRWSADLGQKSVAAPISEVMAYG